MLLAFMQHFLIAAMLNQFFHELNIRTPLLYQIIPNRHLFPSNPHMTAR